MEIFWYIIFGCIAIFAITVGIVVGTIITNLTFKQYKKTGKQSFLAFAILTDIGTVTIILLFIRAVLNSF